MDGRSEKDREPGLVVENHSTAPLAEVYRLKRVSKVTIPSKSSMDEAKSYVDSNQK